MASTVKSDIEIARAARMQPIEQVGSALGISSEDLLHYGPHKAKVSVRHLKRIKSNPAGKLILVTAISPTPAGEGKPPQRLAWEMASIVSARRRRSASESRRSGPALG